MGFVKPEKKREGTKFLFFGEAGSGKTPTALSFPNIALVDSDSGSNFYDLSNVIVTTDKLSYKDLADDLDELEMDEELFEEIDTFAVDSITRFHDTMTIAMNRVAENRAIENGRDAEAEGISFKERGKMKTYYEEFFGRMITYAKQGKNLVFVAEEKDKIENIDGQLKKVGVIPDAQKGIEYDFDVVVRTFKHETYEGGQKVVTPKGEVLKDRTGTFAVGTIIDKPNYALWKDAVERNKQGKRRTKDEIKSVSQAVAEEMNVLDDGAALRKEALDLAKKLAKEGKTEEVKNALNDAIGTHQIGKVKDVKKLEKVLEVLKGL